LMPQFFVAVGVSAGVFAAVALIMAPRRIAGMLTRLHRALLGVQPAV